MLYYEEGSFLFSSQLVTSQIKSTRNAPNLLYDYDARWRKGTVPAIWTQAEWQAGNSKDTWQFGTVTLSSFFSYWSGKWQNRWEVVPWLIRRDVHLYSPAASNIRWLMYSMKRDRQEPKSCVAGLCQHICSIPNNLSRTHYSATASKTMSTSSSKATSTTFTLMRFSTEMFEANWIELQKWIITGCTIFVILVIKAMNLIIKIAERETSYWEYDMGDMTIITETHIQVR